MPVYFDRYKQFKVNGESKPVPNIIIPNASTDKEVLYKLGSSRLDNLSQEYYGNPYHGWLILMANPKYGGLEWEIPDRTVIRIPFPFNDALNRYQSELDRYITLYG